MPQRGTRIKVLRGHEGEVIFASFGPDETRIVTASLDRTARLWDVATGNEIKVLRGMRIRSIPRLSARTERACSVVCQDGCKDDAICCPALLS